MLGRFIKYQNAATKDFNQSGLLAKLTIARTSFQLTDTHVLEEILLQKVYGAPGRCTLNPKPPQTPPKTLKPDMKGLEEVHEIPLVRKGVSKSDPPKNPGLYI